jgi:hypothetical protein
MENRSGRGVACRLQEADGCRRTLNPANQHPDWSVWQFRQRFLDAGYDIFVVTLDALAEFLGIVRKAAVDSGKGRTRIGSLTLDKDGDAHLTPLDQSTA